MSEVIFNVAAGEAAKEVAIATVDEAADEAWKAAALKAVHDLSYQEAYFTTDAVWAKLDDTEHSTSEPRAMGPVMRRAVSAGWIEATNKHWLSKRPACHRRPLRVWRGRFALHVGGKTP